MSIGQSIVNWYENKGRDLPWRNTRDPYPIWISEIILQQTRIAQGIGYYERFLGRFPNLKSLAEAEQDEVLKYWEGLGYYSRARNLHAAAQQLMNDYGGVFPDHYTELLKLKGVGPYTARAIGSFAFDNATGVIDGNVLRVMSRMLNDFSPIDVPATRKQFQKIIDTWVAAVPSSPFNQGIMDIGSTICTPTKPACLICPLLAHCEGYQQGSIHLLPQKAKKLKRKDRYFHFYLIQNEAQAFIVRQRPSKGLWGGLWEVPNREIEKEKWDNKLDEEAEASYLGSLKHVFTHFDMHIQVFSLLSERSPTWAKGQFIVANEIDDYAFAKAMLKIFDQYIKKD
ncbi:MAG: A/G-specific adenine glycosylase [Bacteroidia bacterium]